MINKLHRAAALLLLISLALGASVIVNGCGGDSHHDSRMTLRSINFYPAGSVIVDNTVMDATRTIEVNPINAVEVTKAESPVKFVLIALDADNNYYMIGASSHVYVNWENGADYSKYVKLSSDKRSLEYVASTSKVMTLVASYQAVEGGTPVQAFLDVTTSDGAEQVKAIEFYPEGASIDPDDPNVVIDEDGYELEPITEFNLYRDASPAEFTAVAVFANTRGILTDTDHVDVYWENDADYSDYVVIGSDNRTLYYVSENSTAMPLVVEYRRDTASEEPTATNTLKVYSWYE